MVLRPRLGVVALIVALTTLAAGVYLSTAPKVYEAHTDILVTPLSRDDQILGLGLIHESVDPTRDVETVSRLAVSPGVALKVKRALDLPEDPEAILGRIRVEPIAQSNLVTITAQGGSPDAAAALANRFSSVFLEQRTEQLHRALDQAIPRVEARIAALDPTAADASELPGELARMRLLREGPDPTLRAESPAVVPRDPVSPRPLRSIVAALFGGTILGVLAVLALQLLDRRVRTEEQLRERYRLPILARIPNQRRTGRRPVRPEYMSMAARDAYARLHASVLGLSGMQQHGRVLMVTSASQGDGKSTTALNLAWALAEFDRNVILIDGDIRRPALAEALDLPILGPPSPGASAVERSLVALPDEPRIRLLDGDSMAALIRFVPSDGLATTAREASELADFVIVDLPPLTALPSLFPVVDAADDVLVVIRLGNTWLRDLDELAEMFMQRDLAPSGFVLLGTARRQPYG
jgi:capsular polysaccharide biosynthesis protein